jgi:hypothetical protein
VRTSCRFVFFILGARRQIGRINEGHGGLVERRINQQFPKQMIVNLSKTACAQTPAKIVEHPRIRKRQPIGQMRKATPLFLFFQAADKCVEAERAG